MHFSPLLLAAKVTSTITQGAQEAPEGLTSKIAGFFGFFFTNLPAWIAAFIIFGLTIGIARMIRSIVESKIAAKVSEEHQEMVILGGRISYVMTLAIGITAALKIAGIDITTIVAAVAFGIGFALRDLIMNFIAGIYILMSKQFTIGDLIKINGIMGKVVEIQSRATILKAIDGTKVIVPNSDLFSNNVISYTGNSMRRIVIPLYVSYDTDLSFAIKVAMKALKNNPKIQRKPAPTVIIKDYGDYTIDLAARFWVLTKDKWVKVRSEMIIKFNMAFNEAGIVIPYQTVHLETAQDTAEDEKEAAATQKIMKERFAEQVLQKKMAIQGTVPQTTNGTTNGNGVLAPMANGTPAALAPELVTVTAETIEPEGPYEDEMDIDDQTVDNKG